MPKTKLNTKLLKKLSEAHGAPGFEYNIRNMVMDEIRDHVDSMEIDNMGNLTAIKKGKKSKKVMVAAHMDEIGFMVTHIDDNGFVRFCPLGGFDPKTLTAQRVIVHGKKDLLGVLGSKPVHVMSPEERKAGADLKKYFIDLGLSKKEVEKHVKIGDPITWKQTCEEIGDTICGKSMDNRLSVFILIEVLKAMKEPDYDFYAVFTVQEEVGVRGAIASAHEIQPDFGLGLDVTIACDIPGMAKHEYISEIGKGVAIKSMDGGAISDYRMVEFLMKLADKNKINYQNEAYAVGGTDTRGIQLMTSGGCISGGISIPLRNIHQTVELVHKEDVVSTIDLLTEFVENTDKGDWKHK